MALIFQVAVAPKATKAHNSTKSTAVENEIIPTSEFPLEFSHMQQLFMLVNKVYLNHVEVWKLI